MEAGFRFGKLVCLRPNDSLNKDGRSLHFMACDCGDTCFALGAQLNGGKKKSCGCLQAEARRKSGSTIKHGHNRKDNCSPTYKVWTSMLARCRNPLAPNYARYGGSGISVCESWSSFESFLNDMGERPSLNHSIDRIDNNSGYQPGNCRWATWGEQARNRSSTVFLEHDGRRMCLADWAREIGITRANMSARIKKTDNIEEILRPRDKAQNAKDEARKHLVEEKA